MSNKRRLKQVFITSVKARKKLEYLKHKINLNIKDTARAAQ
jgi:hypothetical protein